jgi:hypothetical protein
METKEIKIECPEGFEIDKEKSTFEKIVFKKKEKSLPKSWIEFAKLQECNHTFHLGCEILNYNGYSSVFVPDKYATAIAELNKLIRLRDYYNDGWEPDWKNQHQDKYSIITIGNSIIKDCTWCRRCILSFKDKETRNEFYNNFKDLIEQAKELI